MAEALAAHWKPVFDPPKDPDSERRKARMQKLYLEHFATPAPEWDSLPPPGPEALRQAVARARPAAPGPDGLPAAAWGAAKQGIEILYRASVWLRSGYSMRSDFNCAIGVFIPKSQAPSDGSPLSCPPCAT
eukprot:9413276-Pyramimonas_sp.AAC.1